MTSKESLKSICLECEREKGKNKIACPFRSISNEYCEEYDTIKKDLVRLEKYDKTKNIYGVDLLILFKASSFGFYYKENNEIKYKRFGAAIVGKYLVETKPVYAVKETTLNGSYYGDVESMKKVDDAHYWDWKTCKHWEIKDYGKDWALTREELE